MEIEAGGLNESERVLGRLARKSFLRLWSYSNLYRGPGQELSDLVVVFDKHVVIFSDKKCELPLEGDLNTTWARWYRRAVSDSIRQAYGATRWIREHPHRVFMDAKCEQPFAMPVPPRDEAVVHRVCVASGALHRARREGVRGLRIAIGPAASTDAVPVPFSISRIDFGKGFVHVWDEVGLDAIMSELNTVADFTDYLDSREALLRGCEVVECDHETDMLALHVWHRATDPTSRFGVAKEDRRIKVERGAWEKLKHYAHVIEKKELDKVSFLWDEIIELVASDAMEKKLLCGSPSIGAIERALRLMASENRFRRRVLATALIDFISRAPSDRLGRRVVPDPKGGAARVYVFQTSPAHTATADEDTRMHRARLLFEYCVAVAFQYRQLREVVGIGTEAGVNNGGRSYELSVVSPSEWNTEMERLAEAAFKRVRPMDPERTTWHRHTVNEYPPAPPLG